MTRLASNPTGTNCCIFHTSYTHLPTFLLFYIPYLLYTPANLPPVLYSIPLIHICQPSSCCIFNTSYTHLPTFLLLYIQYLLYTSANLLLLYIQYLLYTPANLPPVVYSIPLIHTCQPSPVVYSIPLIHTCQPSSCCIFNTSYTHLPTFLLLYIPYLLYTPANLPPVVYSIPLIHTCQPSPVVYSIPLIHTCQPSSCCIFQTSYTHLPTFLLLYIQYLLYTPANLLLLYIQYLLYTPANLPPVVYSKPLIHTCQPSSCCIFNTSYTHLPTFSCCIFNTSYTHLPTFLLLYIPYLLYTPANLPPVVYSIPLIHTCQPCLPHPCYIVYILYIYWTPGITRFKMFTNMSACSLLIHITPAC